ncbi:hypothetical protein GBK02_15425 [Dechloromonas sp. TW-R-39-2]|uniref:hypothetical protein n=1 Tax=Dechloromonas sp. TW-R-39-2 TaxID=2654218 RepID=UPI00193CF09D|nr:hypothetical protein [Dechloromonas sp. TW-R-39-2]QRM20671.1 hypothetical protein GBK02_15425 [Dechloromonas sp. TW-R-39-2]
MLEKLNGSNAEALELLATAGVHLIEQRPLPPEVMKWLGYGLLALCRGEGRNVAFGVADIKSPSNKNAWRWAMVERFRKTEGLSKDDAVAKVALIELNRDFPDRKNDDALQVEGVKKSWSIQNKIQKGFAQRIK